MTMDNPYPIWLTDLVLAYLLRNGRATVQEVTRYAVTYYGTFWDGLVSRVEQELNLLVLGGVAVQEGPFYVIRRHRVPEDTIERLKLAGLL